MLLLSLLQLSPTRITSAGAPGKPTPPGGTVPYYRVFGSEVLGSSPEPLKLSTPPSLRSGRATKALQLVRVGEDLRLTRAQFSGGDDYLGGDVLGFGERNLPKREVVL